MVIADLFNAFMIACMLVCQRIILSLKSGGEIRTDLGWEIKRAGSCMVYVVEYMANIDLVGHKELSLLTLCGARRVMCNDKFFTLIHVLCWSVYFEQ
jgi:hypothetical protein